MHVDQHLLDSNWGGSSGWTSEWMVLSLSMMDITLTAACANMRSISWSEGRFLPLDNEDRPPPSDCRLCVDDPNNNVELLSQCVTQAMPYQARNHVAVYRLDFQSKSAHALMSNEVCWGYSVCFVGKSWSSTVVVAMTLIGHVVCWSSFYGHVASHQCWKRCPWIRMQRNERKLQVVTCSRKRDKRGECL